MARLTLITWTPVNSETLLLEILIDDQLQVLRDRVTHSIEKGHNLFFFFLAAVVHTRYHYVMMSRNVPALSLICYASAFLLSSPGGVYPPLRCIHKSFPTHSLSMSWQTEKGRPLPARTL